jgi:hypothetical protein
VEFLDKNTSATNIVDYLLGNLDVPPLCDECIYTTMGVVNPALCTMRQKIRDEGDDYTVNEGTGNETTVYGWRTLVPILPLTPCPDSKGTGCFDDPGYQPGDAFQVTEFAEVVITDAIPQGTCPASQYGDTGPYAGGNPGIVLVGLGNGGAGTTTISCVPCAEDPPTFSRRIKLVQ